MIRRGGKLPQFCRSCRSFAAIMPLDGMFAAGVFRGVIWDVVREMERVSAWVGCGMVVFVGFGGLVGRAI